MSLFLAKSCTRTEWLYSLKDSHHRILFQNASGTINMVQYLNDPNLELEEIALFHILAEIMIHTYKHVKGSQRLIKLQQGRSLFEEDEYMSCYVELHRIDYILGKPYYNLLFTLKNNGLNNQKKPFSWLKWSKPYSSSYSIEVFTGRRV